MTKDDIKPEDVYTVGTVVTIRQIAKLASNNLRVNVEGTFLFLLLHKPSRLQLHQVQHQGIQDI